MGLEFIEGNEAIARAAMKSGCDFFAGYPITPASSILHYMNEFVPEAGGTVIQGEDEIASIGFCIGAAMAGRKAMTASSGPGISLYSENLGLAIIGETPLVVVDVQRQGPATGSATKGAEGDILFTRWVTSGGMPTIALSPASVEEAYLLTFHAFNFAEKYRTPVFVLASKEIAVTRESVDLDAVELPERVERKQLPAGVRHYRPYAFERSEDVPAFSPFGGEHIARYTTSSHDHGGYLTSSPEVIQQMIDHYIAKIESAADDLTLVKRDLEPGARTLVVSYGVTSRAAAVAVRAARRRGSKVSHLVLQTLYPVPGNAIREAMEGVERVVVPEMNMGQYVLEIERLARPGAGVRGIEVVGVGKMNTTLLSPEEITLRGGLA